MHPSPPKPSAPPKKSALFWLWGTHSVIAALENTQRECHQLLCTRDALKDVEPFLAKRPKLSPKILPRDELNRLLPQTVHQGVALQVSPLPELFLNTFLARSPAAKRLVILDQITDPQNVGAILRSACAFGFDGVLMTERHSPPLEGVVGKSASGALEKIPLLMTANVAQGLRLLKTEGFWCWGLSEEGTLPLSQLPCEGSLALVLGAEGKGLRPLTAQLCDGLVRLPTSPDFPTLNVAAAAAVAFYQVVL
ncbi:hypothetical protein DAPPUDRAFT_315299 [Daphnia pulex]|uniref:RNA 2-O ribose methyltransferase substrate binding domain-containing protein n=1 Tax=Daphnia pulex TaxID=6669 RepID=E9G9C3_DAPPU|nr:hypothetical protein DAPPUDRAFT_315299 [Daphnia pulex]|eukprot:EFX83907.1 hypothetical protein DAPPUDRAFT_315299 [Daphnia pulex]